MLYSPASHFERRERGRFPNEVPDMFFVLITASFSRSFRQLHAGLILTEKLARGRVVLVHGAWGIQR